MKMNSFRKEITYGYLFILPNILGFAIFVGFPVAFSLYLSFHSWNGFTDMHFVGWDNFISLINSATFWKVIQNNLLYTIGTVPISIALGLFSAILVSRGLKSMTLFKTILFFPNITSPVAVALVFGAIFSREFGPVNSFLRSIGFDNPPGWFASTQWALVSVMILGIWKIFGYLMILFLAGLQGIPTTLYEAATVDGANSYQKFRFVTLPMLAPTMQLVISMSIIWSLQVWDLIYASTGGGPGDATRVMVFEIIRAAFTLNNFGYASALSWVLFIITFCFAIVQYTIQQKQINETF
ncbi:MAG: sugar ABC transporter permease [Gorillibacterium sp.]|nr:sugar ABC transporter permease [Gorillibacterium sp.]